ncbi:hypothetical protein D3C73_1576420 [compost metagenome]
MGTPFRDLAGRDESMVGRNQRRDKVKTAPQWMQCAAICSGGGRFKTWGRARTWPASAAMRQALRSQSAHVHHCMH